MAEMDNHWTNDGQPGDDLDLVAELRRTLEHIYDQVYLQRCALVQVLAEVSSSTTLAQAAKAVRKLLVDAIDELDPGDGVGAASPARRGYVALRRRYLNQEPAEDVAEALSLSERQVRREVRAALEALAVIIRGRLSADEKGHEPQAGESSELRREIESLEPNWGAIDLAVELAALHDLVRPLAEEHTASLCPVSTSGSTVVLSERVLLRQALLALYTEAVQALNGSRVETSVQPLGERQITVRVAVVAPSGCQAPDDCGPIKETILEALRASCQVTSSEDDIVYSLRLPAAPLTRVLLIDDNRSIHQLVRRYLVGYPYAMASAFDGDQALAMIEAEQPDVVILDVMMSGRDGWELLRQMRSTAPLQEIPVIVCSVLEQAALARSLGADAYLTKPVTQDALLATLGELTSRD